MKSTKQIKTYSEQESFFSKHREELYVKAYSAEKPGIFDRVTPHRHAYYEIIFVWGGSGTHIIDFTDYTFTGPCLFLLHPQNIHTVKKDTPTSGGVVKFSSALFANIKTGIGSANFLDVFDDTDIMPVINLSKGQSKEIEKLFNDLNHEYHQNSIITPQLLILYLKIFILKIFSIKKHDVCSDALLGPDVLRFRRFQELVEKNFRHHHAASFYTNQLNVSLRTLGNIACRAGGPTPSTLIKERILLEAKRLLYNSGLSVKEIGYELGFETSSYFIRFFRLNTGLSPLQLKQQILKN
jgi:AraC family transcriptional activator of pobA